MRKTIWVTLIILTCGLLQAQAQQSQVLPPHISVTGLGEVKVVPDEVVLNFGVEMREQSLEQARKQVDSKAAAVIAYLKKQGVEERNIRTSYMNVHPIYQGGDYGRANPEYYMAQKTMTVVIKKLNKFDELVSGLYGAGINRIDGVSFRVSEMEKHKAEAQKRAISNARQKANVLTAELGTKVGRVYSVSESINGDGPRPMYAKSALMEVAMDNSMEGPSIAGGEVVISSNVHVTFLLE